MATSLNDFIAELPIEDQKEIATHTQDLMLEYKTLMQIRKLCEFTQVDMAEAMGMTQGAVAGIEKRDDFLVSTLEKYAEAIGASLDIVVSLADGTKYRVNAKEGA